MSAADAGEVTGLDQSIAYAQHLAEQAGAHGHDGNEGYLAYLAARKVTGEGLASGRVMQDAFAAAAATAAAHAAQLAKQKTVQEAYDMNPDAGGKTYLTGQPDGDPAPDDAPSPGVGPLPDVARLTDLPSGHWHGSDVVTGAGDDKVVLGVVRYTDGEQPSNAYVVVATTTDPAFDPDSTEAGILPALSPAEAGRLADELDDLATLAEAGVPANPPTPLAKLADRIRGLAGDSGVTIAGDQGETEVPAALLRQLLDAAAPPPAVPTRRKVTATDCDQDRMDNGTVWAELDTTGAAPVVAVTATEGTEQPDESPGFYTTTGLPPADARALAGKLRRFAEAAPQLAAGPAHGRPDVSDQAVPQAAPGRAEPDPVEQEIRQAYQRLTGGDGRYVALAEIRDAVPTKDRARVDQALQRLLDEGNGTVALEPEPFGHRIGPRERQNAVHIGGEDRHKLAIEPSPGTSAPPAPAAIPAGPRRVTNNRGKKFEYDPGTGATAVIEPDGWRAVVPPSSPTGVAARLLYWNAEIKDGRGDDATEAAARALLDPLSAADLRELADDLNVPARGARTKSQMVDSIVNSAIGSARKNRALRQR